MSLSVWLVAAVALAPAYPAVAQNNTPAPAATDQQPAPAAPASPDGAKVDEFVQRLIETQQQVNGPAGNPECYKLGSQVLSLLQNNDIDTAFRYLDLYDRFGCPGAHVQAAYRCFLLHPLQMTADRKLPEQKATDLESHIQACWINPTAPVIAATPAAAPAPAATAPSAAAPSQTSTH